MKKELKKLAKKIKNFKIAVKESQRAGNTFGQYDLELLQATYRAEHLFYSLYKKKVKSEEVSITKIIELGIERKPINSNKEYYNPHIEQIKRRLYKLEEDQEDGGL